MAKPLHVILISFILLMMPLAGCIDGEEKIEEDEEPIEQEPAVVIKGCMDNNSANYDPNATEDDNSCMALLPKDALIALYESWGSHMYTPILDDEDSRVGVELTVTTTEEVMYPGDLKDDSQSGRSTAESQTSWEGTRTSVVRDVPNLSPDTLKDDSGAYVITSVISDGTVLRHSDNTTDETEDTVIKQSVRYGDDVVVRTSDRTS